MVTPVAVVVTVVDSDLKTPEEWSKIKGYRIMDPDGWRTSDAPDWNTPINEAEFLRRAAVSTIRIINV